MLFIRCKRVVRHCLFWIGILAFFSSFEFLSARQLLSDATYAKLYWINLFFESLPAYLFFTYTLLYGVFPLLLRRRYAFCLVAFSGLMVSSFLLQKLLAELDLYLIQPFLLDFPSEPDGLFVALTEDLHHVTGWITFSYDFVLVGFLAAGINLFNAWTRKQRESRQLEYEKLQTELHLLKLNVNPSFLFNSLNVLYTLIRFQPKQAPDMVLHLAHFLRYMLYESQEATGSLHREMEIITYYLSLQRIMHPDGLDVSFTSRGTVGNQSIAPLSLFPIVERAFHHLTELPATDDAAAGDPATDDPTWVSIDLAIEATHLTLKVINGHDHPPDNAVWLTDIRKQLYFHYDDAFSLQVWAEPDTYIVSLTLPLSSEHAVVGTDGLTSRLTRSAK